MCGSTPSSSSGGGTSNIVRGGRGSNIAERKKSKLGQAVQDTFAGLGGSMIAGPFGSIAATQLSKRANTTEINLSTGKRTQAFDEIKSSFDDSTARQEAGKKQTALTAATATEATTKAATATATAADDKAKAASIKKRGGKRTKTVLAGAKIAEEKLKTKLGQ